MVLVSICSLSLLVVYDTLLKTSGRRVRPIQINKKKIHKYKVLVSFDLTSSPLLTLWGT